MTNVRGSKLREERHTVVSDAEFQHALNSGAEIKNKFLCLRTLAVPCILRLTGKRREEIAMLPLKSFKVENDMLHVTFMLEKKRKRFKKCPNC